MGIVRGENAPTGIMYLPFDKHGGAIYQTETGVLWGKKKKQRKLNVHGGGPSWGDIKKLSSLGLRPQNTQDLTLQVAEVQRRLNSQSRKICHAEVRAWLGRMGP